MTPQPATIATASHLQVQKRVALQAIELEAIELAARGMTQREIGSRIGRTRSAVSKMLTRTERKLAVLLKDRGQEIKAGQTVKLEHIYRQSMTAWEQSKQDAETHKTIEGTNDGKRTERTRKAQCGDARFLDQAQKALEDIRKIWGLNEQDKSASSNTNVTIRVEYAEDFFGRNTIIDSEAIAIEEASVGTEGDDGNHGQED